MELRSGALCRKQILCIGDGRCLGYADELLLSCEGLEEGKEDFLSETHHPTAGIQALVVRGRLRWFGIMGRDPDLLIPWTDILIIGEDAILIRGVGQEVPAGNTSPGTFKENVRRIFRKLPGRSE